MEITVTGKHIEITPAIKDYASEKAAKLPRYFDRVQSIEVVADGDVDHDHNHEVEMIVSVEHREPFVAKASGDDLYGCIDAVVDKLERQLSDYKKRIRNRKHNIS